MKMTEIYAKAKRICQEQRELAEHQRICEAANICWKYGTNMVDITAWWNFGRIPKVRRCPDCGEVYGKDR